MKIFIPFTIKGIGGVSTFAKKFKSGLEKNGHEVFFEFKEDYDVLFLIVQCQFKYLLDAKRRNKKIIQRLDGYWYWSVVGWRYPLYNLKARIIRHFFTDFTVYQSNYSKYCTKKFIGNKKKDSSAIIYNGADLNIFSAHGEKKNLRDNPNQLIFFTASAFRRKDQIIPIIESLEIYRNKFNNNFKLLVAGGFTGKVSNIPARYKSKKYIDFLGEIKNENLPCYERSSDVFLFTHLNPPCPNNIIEAMGCGLPICGVSDGAMPELIEQSKNGLLIPIQGNAFWKTRKYDINEFSNNLNYIINNIDSFKKKSREIAENKFSLSTMIKNYITIIEKLI